MTKKPPNVAVHEWLSPEWMQRGLEALKATLDVDNDLKCQMVQFLFDCGLWNADNLSWDAGMARFNAALNPNKPQVKFSLAEIWALMRQFARHELLFAMCDDLGYEQPRKLATEQRRQELLERLAAAIEQANRLSEQAAAELGRLHVQRAPRRIHPALRDGGTF